MSEIDDLRAQVQRLEQIVNLHEEDVQTLRDRIARIQQEVIDQLRTMNENNRETSKMLFTMMAKAERWMAERSGKPEQTH